MRTVACFNNNKIVRESIRSCSMIDDEEGQAIAEDDVMENIKVMYDVFIQNNLANTSHSIEWLRMTHQ